MKVVHLTNEVYLNLFELNFIHANNPCKIKSGSYVFHILDKRGEPLALTIIFITSLLNTCSLISNSDKADKVPHKKHGGPLLNSLQILSVIVNSFTNHICRNSICWECIYILFEIFTFKDTTKSICIFFSFVEDFHVSIASQSYGHQFRKIHSKYIIFWDDKVLHPFL